MPYENLLQFRLPQKREVEVHIVRLEDGRVVARTTEELQELKKQKKG